MDYLTEMDNFSFSDLLYYKSIEKCGVDEMITPLLSAVLGLIVKQFTKTIPFKPVDFKLDNIKKSAVLSLKVITDVIVFMIIFILNVNKIFGNAAGIVRLLIQSAVLILLTIIVILTALLNKESLQSLGITKINLGRASVLGLLLGIIFFIIYKSFSGSNNVTSILSIESLIYMIEFLIVGFAEEIIFRGYFQTRMITWLGRNKGCIITAVIFSFIHIPQNMVIQGLSLQAALINCCFEYIPLSLMFGYIQLKTKTIIPGSILHTIINWSQNF